MKSVRTLVALLALAAIAFGGWLSVTSSKAEDPKKAPPADPPKGQLRPGWDRIGLSRDQVEKVYGVQAEYKPKVEALEKQLKALKDEQLAKELDVLTGDE